MHRRKFVSLISVSSCSLLIDSCSLPRANSDPKWSELLQQHGIEGARLGIAILDTQNKQFRGFNQDEHFPLCSTFKAPLAAAILSKVDAKDEQLQRRIEIRKQDIQTYAPVTSARVGSSLSIEELCAAAVTFSDNTAANLLLATLGGPEGLTQQIRQWGDTHTRLDRWEPEMNESRPGDLRDTTTPRAMIQLLEALLLRDTLSHPSRQRLMSWMRASTTNKNRLASKLPAGWEVASKTGTGDNGSTNDAGVLFPPDRPPILVAVYLTETNAPISKREAMLASVSHFITHAPNL